MQEGQIAGTYAGVLGQNKPVKGSLKDGDLALQFTGDWPDGTTAEVTLVGKLEGSSGKGNVTVQARTEGTWTATISKVQDESGATETTAPAAVLNTGTGTGALVLIVPNVKASQGTLRVALFRGPQGFPSEWDRKAAIVEQPASEGRMEVRFAELTPGECAAMVVHDANDNQNLDRNAFGIPKEGFGASNGEGKLKAPKCDEARVVVAANEEARTHAILRY